MKLYEIGDAYHRVQELAIEGEDLAVAMEQLEGEFGAKAENVAKVVLQLQAEEKGFKDEASRLSGHATARALPAPVKSKRMPRGEGRWGGGDSYVPFT